MHHSRSQPKSTRWLAVNFAMFVFAGVGRWDSPCPKFWFLQLFSHEIRAREKLFPTTTTALVATASEHVGNLNIHLIKFMRLHQQKKAAFRWFWKGKPPRQHTGFGLHFSLPESREWWRRKYKVLHKYFAFHRDSVQTWIYTFRSIQIHTHARVCVFFSAKFGHIYREFSKLTFPPQQREPP